MIRQLDLKHMVKVASFTRLHRWRRTSSAFQKTIKLVLRCCGTGLGASGADITLRGHQGLMAEELHQRVHADIGVGELGGEGRTGRS
jgi:hypothetical protein